MSDKPKAQNGESRGRLEQHERRDETPSPRWPPAVILNMIRPPNNPCIITMFTATQKRRQRRDGFQAGCRADGAFTRVALTCELPPYIDQVSHRLTAKPLESRKQHYFVTTNLRREPRYFSNTMHPTGRMQR